MTPHRFLSFISENIYFPWSFLWLQFSSRTRKWWTFVSQEERSIACIYAILVFHFMPTLPNFVWTIPSTTCLWGTHYIAFLLCSSCIPSMPSNIYFFMFEKPVTFISLSWPAAVIPAIVCCRVENLFPFNRLAAQYLYHCCATYPDQILQFFRTLLMIFRRSCICFTQNRGRSNFLRRINFSSLGTLLRAPQERL